MVKYYIKKIKNNINSPNYNKNKKNKKYYYKKI